MGMGAGVQLVPLVEATGVGAATVVGAGVALAIAIALVELEVELGAEPVVAKLALAMTHWAAVSANKSRYAK
jgi:hypothetical protein